jgi:hypothetical protein
LELRGVQTTNKKASSFDKGWLEVATKAVILNSKFKAY